MGIKQKITNAIDKYTFLRLLHAAYLCIFSPKRIAYVKNPSFEGWGMTTTTTTPWKNNGNHALTKNFSIVDAKLKDFVRDKKFILSQFPQMFPNKDQIKFLNELNWRHYIVYWSSTYAVKNTKTEQKNLAECGVCDGLSTFYAINAVKDSGKCCCTYLYDAWDAMKEELLLESEKGRAGDYAYLDVKATEKNLSMFDSKTLIFNKGYIPDSFATSANPDSLVWLHIDLNSSAPTIGAMNFFWDKIEKGGVILFDDYAHPGYEDTQKVIEEWLASKDGVLLHLPTGQAMILKGQFV